MPRLFFDGLSIFEENQHLFPLSSSARTTSAEYFLSEKSFSSLCASIRTVRTVNKSRRLATSSNMWPTCPMKLSRVRGHRTAEILPGSDTAHDFFSGGFFLSSLSTNWIRFASCSGKFRVTAPPQHFHIRFLQIAELLLDLVETRARPRFVPCKLRELFGHLLIFKFRTVPREHFVNCVRDVT